MSCENAESLWKAFYFCTHVGLQIWLCRIASAAMAFAGLYYSNSRASAHQNVLPGFSPLGLTQHLPPRKAGKAADCLLEHLACDVVG